MATSEHRVRRIGAILGPILIGLAGTALALQAFAKMSVDTGPFRVQLEADFGRSVTDFSLPPLGRLRADTHAAPLHLRASLREVDVAELRERLQRSLDSVAAEVERNLVDAAGRFAAWIVLVGVAGAAALGFVAFRTRWLRVLRATTAGLLAVLLSVAIAAVGYDASAFRTPSYSGSLQLVPQLLGPAEGAIARVGYFREELRRIVAGAARAYDAVESNPLGGGDEIRLLHISDIHLSTLGYGFAQELAESFDADLVVDTGDTSSFGTPGETFILAEIPAFERPYVFVRGNHDSVAFQQAVERVRNATVLDGDTEVFAGLTIYGLGDPYFVQERGEPVSDEEVEELVRSTGARIAEDLEGLREPPDIVMVHDDRMAAALAGSVPLVISGHFHENRSQVVNGTLFLRVGTTGGAGPTGFTAEGDVPFSAEVLYFEPDETGRMRLVAWDVVTQTPETASLEIQRHLAPTDIALTPAPSPSGEEIITPAPTE